MKAIFAINKKFMDYTPLELITLIKNNSKYVDGFEIYIDYKNEFELKYLYDFAYCCKQNNYHFQVHGDSNLSVNDQIEFLKMLEGIYDMLNYKIHVVLHSINNSVIDTTNYLNEVIDNINNSKLIISLENLNDSTRRQRLDVNDITPIIANDERLFLTYDVGHVMIEYNDVLDMNPNLVPLISNIHIHSLDYSYCEGFDHKPIFKGDMNWNKIIKFILFLKNNNYDDSIVFEYDLFSCPGDTIEERIISYCNSIDYVAERFK